MDQITETRINIISEGTVIHGETLFDHVTRIHGVLKGKVKGKEGSTLIISETGAIEGDVKGDTIFVDGLIDGDLYAKKKVFISSTGRVIGNIQTPSFEMEFGGYFEGACQMNSQAAGKTEQSTEEKPNKKTTAAPPPQQ